jgi:uncharacterized protein YcbK (DUF882 family)
MTYRVSVFLLTILMCSPVAAQTPQEQFQSNLTAWQEAVAHNMNRLQERKLAMPVSLPRNSSGCRVSGKTEGLDTILSKRLCGMSRDLGTVTVVSGCRKHGSKRSPKSYHKYSRGCKAADVVISGVKQSTIMRYWAGNGGGGTGSYRSQRIVHVDVGPNRSWHW